MDYREEEEGKEDASNQSKPGFMSSNTDNNSTPQSKRGRYKMDAWKQKISINNKQIDR